MIMIIFVALDTPDARLDHSTTMIFIHLMLRRRHRRIDKATSGRACVFAACWWVASIANFLPTLRQWLLYKLFTTGACFQQFAVAIQPEQTQELHEVSKSSAQIHKHVLQIHRDPAKRQARKIPIQYKLFGDITLKVQLSFIRPRKADRSLIGSGRSLSIVFAEGAFALLQTKAENPEVDVMGTADSRKLSEEDFCLGDKLRHVCYFGEEAC